MHSADDARAQPSSSHTARNSAFWSQLDALHSRFRSTPTSVRITCVVVVLANYVSSGMMFFGMNFWLWSFSYGSNTFVSMLIPAIVWAVLFAIPLAAYRRWRRGCGGVEPVRGGGEHAEVSGEVSPLVVPSPASRAIGALPLGRVRFFGMLCLLGLIDSLGGLTSVYSTTHVPVLVQSMLVAGGPLYTYAFSRVLFPRSVHPITPTMVVSVSLLLGGLALSIVPQVQSPNHSLYVRGGWITLYVAGVLLPALLNVVQGRFMDDYRKCFRSPLECQLVALSGDTATQVLFTLAYFPLDSIRGFGSADSLGGSWKGFVDGAHCIFFVCSNNFVYFVVYCMGFWLNKLTFTYLNLYSPTVGAVVGQLSQPINTCLLLLFPTLNVFGQPGTWWATLGCFALLLTSMVLFVAWHESMKLSTESGAERRRMSVVLPLPEPFSPAVSDDRPAVTSIQKQEGDY